MPVEHALKEFFEPGVYFLLLWQIPMAILLIGEKLHNWNTACRGPIIIAGVNTGLALAVWGLTDHGPGTVIPAAMVLIAALIANRTLKDYAVSGHVMIALSVTGFLFGAGWLLAFIHTVSINPISYTILVFGLATLCLTFPLKMLVFFPYMSYLIRTQWHRPHRALPPSPRIHYPKISLHVPCYAEPPEVVKAMLDALSRLRYPNFEVLVIDNNTKDESLWRPVEAHCRHLGERFRFFHVDPLAGAKAGALNFALRHTAPDAEIVGLIDSDYLAEPDFLARLVGFFDDPAMGYVQTPHDYCAWEASPYQRMCYWEYMPNYRLSLKGLNEWDASYTIGTMCLIRREALEAAGGWAEWCLTEDSECSVRLHAHGYKGIYLTETFGRGLIPETFAGYKKQRWRWTAGPVQQLKRHWRLYLPRPFAAPSALTAWQKLAELSHSLREGAHCLSLIYVPIIVVALLSMVLHGDVVAVPAVLWATIAVGLPVRLALGWLDYRLAGCRSGREMLGAAVAVASLRHAKVLGSLAGWLARRPLAWTRTSKFKALPSGLRSLEAARWEVLLGLLFCGIGAGLAHRAAYTPPDLVFLAAAGMVAHGLSYLAAPVMAVLAEHQLRKEEQAAVAVPGIAGHPAPEGLGAVAGRQPDAAGMPAEEGAAA